MVMVMITRVMMMIKMIMMIDLMMVKLMDSLPSSMTSYLKPQLLLISYPDRNKFNDDGDDDNNHDGD